MQSLSIAVKYNNLSVLRDWFLKVTLLISLLSGASSHAAATNEIPGVPITLSEYLVRVWERNESLQIRMIETIISDEKYKAERGIFEPDFVAGVDAVDRRRPNTAEQRANLGNGLFGAANVYNERNRTYTSAIETLAPTGAKFRLGYSLQSLENNLNAVNANGEWVSTVGIQMTQPLLKNGGVTATMAGIRAAAISSEMSFQDYRKNMMDVISQAEAAYWDLYQAQEQAAIAKESFRIAQTLLGDNKKRLELGKAAEIDVQQAEAGLSERGAIYNEAKQKLASARSRASTFISEAWNENMAGLLAADSPEIKTHDFNFIDISNQAFELNPSYTSLIKQAELEGLRVKVAKNQRLPTLDLKGGYGFSGLARNPGDSWDAAKDQAFPSWSVGLELRVPMGGGVKSRHELKAAELRKEATRQALNGMGITLANTLRSSIFSVTSYRENVDSYGNIVKVHEGVLKTQLARLDAGKVNSRDVLEAEEDVFKAKIASLENIIRYQRSILELELVVGSLLKTYNLDFTQKELQSKTDILVNNGRITREKYEKFLDTMKMEYEKRRVKTSTTAP